VKRTKRALKNPAEGHSEMLAIGASPAHLFFHMSVAPSAESGTIDPRHWTAACASAMRQ
jgi:hypothetical protein